jgi:hypothetical protein
MSLVSERERTAVPVREWVALAISWLVVGVPAAWGVTQVVLKSLALFR